jgi:exodeoxyribonuclease VII small subunit
MAEERDTYEATRARLEEIATAVRKKDVSLEKSIELLEEGVRLANLCTEQVDQAQLADSDPAVVAAAGADSGADSQSVPVSDGPAPDAGADPERIETVPPADTSAGAAPDEDEDVLAEAFADVGDDVERKACEGQTEAFGD